MSSDKEAKPVPAAGGEKDLDDLLDSALEDFDKPKPTAEPSKDAAVAAPGTADAPVDAEWNEEFLNQAKFFEEQMAALFGGGAAADGEAPSAEQFNMGFQKMAEAAQLACQGDGLATAGNSDPNYVDHITQALKGLKEGSANLASNLPTDDMASMFSGLQLGEGGDDANPFMPFVQGMMQSLLSAEVLLPSLRELLQKYPAWLAENEGKVDAADVERYTQQQELFKVICAELEQEKPDDAADVKNERFKKVLALMQKLHEYGQPPADIVGDDSMPGMGGLPGALPGMPGAEMGADPSQCSIM